MLEITDHGSIREVRLARPPVNALNPEFVGRQMAVLRDAMTQSEAIVITGRPGVFCAGLDVLELLPLGRSDMRAFWRDFIGLLETIACAPVPVAAAITGHAPAGGTLLSLMADYRVMNDGAYKIGLNETRVGLVLPPLLQEAFTRVIGPRNAEKMLVPGTLIEPSQALEIGLVDAVEDGFDETIAHAIHWCRELLALPRHAMLANREIARAHFKQAFATNAENAVETLTNAWLSDATQAVLHEFVARLKKKT